MDYSENQVKRTHLDYLLLGCVLALVTLGLTMVYSSSAVLAQEKLGSSIFYLKKMILYTSLGFTGLMAVLYIPYRTWRRLVYPILLLSLASLAALEIQELAFARGGATRWLRLGPIRFQPSEFAKVAMLIFLAYSLERKFVKVQKFSIGILPHVTIVGIFLVLILRSKDLGSAGIVGLITLTMLYLGGARILHLAALVLASVPFLYYLISEESYRVKRILAFLNPWGDPQGIGFQIIQSFVAIREGGFFGKGLGAGQQKLFYLPEAHSDFIFSVVGEELGFLGLGLTIGLFSFFCWRGFSIGARAPDLFGRYLAIGITCLIGFSAFLNMGVALGLFPTKGMVLPFLSYGGSAQVAGLIAIGILLNISTYKGIYEISVGTKGFPWGKTS